MACKNMGRAIDARPVWNMENEAQARVSVPVPVEGGGGWRRSKEDAERWGVRKERMVNKSEGLARETKTTA